MVDAFHKTLAEADGDELLMINIIADVHLYPPHFTSDSKPIESMPELILNSSRSLALFWKQLCRKFRHKIPIFDYSRGSDKGW